jgi:hypothetical protein
MDLVAVVNQDEQLNVYRFGGQRAFGLQRRNATSKVISLCWKFNGTGHFRHLMTKLGIYNFYST